MKADLFTYDVWGNARDGYEVNDRHGLRRDVTISHQTFNSDSALKKWIKTNFHFKRNVRLSSIHLDGDERTVYITGGRDEYPIGEIQITHLYKNPR
jgi:hypothetical protein